MGNLSLGTGTDIPETNKAHCCIPFPQDPDFVDRPDIQSWLDEQYAGPAPRIALVGMGGFGYGSIHLLNTSSKYAKDFQEITDGH
jgi:hypothetical protein